MRFTCTVKFLMASRYTCPRLTVDSEPWRRILSLGLLSSLKCVELGFGIHSDMLSPLCITRGSSIPSRRYSFSSIVTISTESTGFLVLYRRNSAHNDFLATECCDNYSPLWRNVTSQQPLVALLVRHHADRPSGIDDRLKRRGRVALPPEISVLLRRCGVVTRDCAHRATACLIARSRSVCRNGLCSTGMSSGMSLVGMTFPEIKIIRICRFIAATCRPKSLPLIPRGMA